MNFEEQNLLLIMSDKESGKEAYLEKEEYGTDVQPRKLSLADATARRQSVALNIVSNPLKVSIHPTLSLVEPG